MANLSYCRLKEPIDAQALHRSLVEINESRFDGLFEISGPSEAGGWLIKGRDPDIDWVAFTIWLQDDGRGFEWPCKGDNVTVWAQDYFAHALAAAQGGEVSGDHDPRWVDPDFHEKFPTFSAWLNRYLRGKHPELQQEELNELPERVREIVERNPIEDQQPNGLER